MTNSADSWSCVISLRFDYDNQGASLAQSKRIDFGPVITDKDEVEMRLRGAQAAILNPDKDPDDFLNKTEQELRDVRSKLKFSKNSVCIDIKDPDATV